LGIVTLTSFIMDVRSTTGVSQADSDDRHDWPSSKNVNDSTITFLDKSNEFLLPEGLFRTDYNNMSGCAGHKRLSRLA
jgi:hypothetical protein